LPAIKINPVTRPAIANGFGLTTAEAENEVVAAEAGMTLLADSEAVYREWRKIVLRYKVSGTQVHDARLAASMYVHGIKHRLTLNITDFNRFTGLTAVHPSTV
jgi:hypothetical protein